MARYLARRISTQIIEYVRITPDPPDLEGPVDLTGFTEDGFELLPWEGQVSLTPPTPTSDFRWGDYPHGAPAWIDTADLDALRARAVDAMSQACADAILAGFVSSALGATYDYPSKVTDQANLTGSVVRSMYASNAADWVTPFWCADAAGDWQYRPHTVAQIQHVGDDAVAARLACMAINEQLAKQIIAADADQLKTIVWPA